MKNQTLPKQMSNSVNRVSQTVEALVVFNQYPDAVISKEAATALKTALNALQRADKHLCPAEEGTRSATAQLKRGAKIKQLCDALDEKSVVVKPVKKAAAKKAAAKKTGKKTAAKKSGKAKAEPKTEAPAENKN